MLRTDDYNFDAFCASMALCNHHTASIPVVQCVAGSKKSGSKWDGRMQAPLYGMAPYFDAKASRT